MKNTRTTEAYKLYYENVLSKDHNNPTLIGRWGADPGGFETQIMCRKMGTKVSDSNLYECDGEVFGPARWPYAANSEEANYSDPPIRYVIKDRMMCIGWTGWHWKTKRSIALGFDFDSIIGHAEGVGVSNEELAKLDKIDVDWIEVIKSTRGGGRHLYIHFDPENAPVTNTHTEHAALARAFIPLIARDTGLDIAASVDVCGSILWIHHVNATEENQGYSLVKPATQLLTADHVPPNWRDNVDVVNGSRTKVKVQGWTSDGKETEGDELDEMTQAHSVVELDEIHLKILDDLEDTGHSSLWVPDHWLWQGHTAGLKHVFDDWAERGAPMRGLFNTNSLDSDPGKPNCFMRPKADGAWDVWRFGEGTDECPIWDTNGKYPHTTYNYPATLKQICLAVGGYEGTEEKHGFLFATLEELKEALKLLESKLEIPDRADGRTLSLHNGPQGKIILVISKDRKDEKRDFPRFVRATRGWEIWIRDTVKTSDVEVEEETLWSELDEKIRALKIDGIRGSQFDSWVLNDATESWTLQPRENIKSYLLSLGFGKPDPILGGAVYKSWALINEPFQPEYPGGRVWNRSAAQFVYAPIELSEGEIPDHPTWSRVMDHCGVELSEYIPELPWGESWGIATGGDYLTAWLACMFQKPFGKLPYLFMYGPQNSGKSSFHESIRLLLTNGVVAADRALTSDQGYNGELEDAVLAVVDEVDISKSGSSTYNKLKEWVTGMTISIHAKYKEPKDVVSCLHFVQMSNTRKSLPVFPGDTRITAMNVPSLEEEIPRDQLQELLKKEAPSFMRTLMDFTIPEATGRLMLPIIETQGKVEAAAGNVDEVSRFIEDNCYKVPGAAVTFVEFKTKFLDSLEEFQRSEWPDRLITSELDELFPVGKGAKVNQKIIGNLTFNEDAVPTTPYSKVEGKVTKEEEE